MKASHVPKAGLQNPLCAHEIAVINIPWVPLRIALSILEFKSDRESERIRRLFLRLIPRQSLSRIRVQASGNLKR